MTKAIAIIQARMGSTRLPGKVMKTLCGKTVLSHVVSRVGQSKKLSAIVIATTTAPQDAAIAEEAGRVGVRHFRGSEQDVLSRYYDAAKENEAEIVVRITSDCPLYDTELLDAMLKTFDPQSCDYLSNCMTRRYPRGLDTEIFKFSALERAHREAQELYQREHVTPYIYQNPALFRLQNHAEGPDHSSLRWTLDTVEDWELISEIYAKLYRPNAHFTTRDILALLEKHPELSAINARVEQKKLTG